MLSQQAWHERYLRQAKWTGESRSFLYHLAGLEQAQHVLEVGCGSGVITADLHNHTPAVCTGIDLLPEFVFLAHQIDRQSNYSAADALALPFADSSFDAVVCHYFLLWVSEPLRALAEMIRVTRPSGAVLALAEPDYGGRIDYPEHLAALGALQMDALRLQGANPLLGRQLPGLLAHSGLQTIQSGVLGGYWNSPPSQQDQDSEWAVLQSDLAGALPEEQFSQWKEADLRAWQAGERVLFVPTFFAWGRVKSPTFGNVD